MEKETIFRRPPELKSEGDYFLDAFPDMPDKAGLYDAMDAITYMSDEGITRIAPESKEKYKSELALARQQMAEVNKTFY